MKTNRILAVALSAGLVLGGASVANAETAAPAVEGEKETETTIGDYLIGKNEKDGYNTKEEAEQAAKLALENDDFNKSYELTQGLNGKWIFRLAPYEEINEEAPSVEDDTQQTPDWKQGLYTESQLEEALATARGDLLIDGLQDIFDVRAVYIKDNERGEKLYAIERFEKPIEEEKPENPEKPEKPEKPVIPETPIEPGETDKPIHGGDDKVEVPEEKEEKEKDSKEVEEKEKENKEKEEKSKEKSKPAKTKGNNPKTGLAGLAPIYSTLAISMAGIVAARKKND